jgi:hypothetical protein
MDWGYPGVEKSGKMTIWRVLRPKTISEPLLATKAILSKRTLQARYGRFSMVHQDHRGPKGYPILSKETFH